MSTVPGEQWSTPGERNVHEGQVTASTMGDALDKDLKRSQDPSLRFPHLAIAKRSHPLGGASDSYAPYLGTADHDPLRTTMFLTMIPLN